MDGKRSKIGIIPQISILFLLGMLLIGCFAYFSQQIRYDSKVKTEIEKRSTEVAQQVVQAVHEYPAYDWLLKYWYNHADTMDIEYDVTFKKNTATEKKSSYLQKKYPDINLRYASKEDIESMSLKDQKAYAEITYSWLITRVNELKRVYKVDFLFCVVPYDSMTKQFFMFSAADPGAVRGTGYEEVYPLGHRVEIIDDAQRRSMETALEKEVHVGSAGDYVDCYYMLGKMGAWPILIGITYSVTDLLSEINKQTVISTTIVLLYQLLMAVICMLLLYSFVIKPLKKVTENIRFYKETKDSETTIENLSEVDTKNEIGQLSDDIIDLTREMDNYTNKIRNITAENERISTELSLANRIQHSMLPRIFPAFPGRKEFEIYASMDPAKEVGGDFYDFFLVDDDHLCMVIADVSGKGVPAALFMMASKIILANNAKMGKSPAQILMDTNDSVCSNNEEEMFVTVWIGILEISTGKMTAANAGHEYPAVKHKDGQFELIKDKHGFVIGGMEGIKYTEYDIDLEPGSCIFLYTDGVPEATDSKEEMFGTDRMLIALNEDSNSKPKNILTAVRNSVDEFTKGAEQFDDLTMLCMRYNGSD